jgi:hypothetical protein
MPISEKSLSNVLRPQQQASYPSHPIGSRLSRLLSVKPTCRKNGKFHGGQIISASGTWKSLGLAWKILFPCSSKSFREAKL